MITYLPRFHLLEFCSFVLRFCYHVVLAIKTAIFCIITARKRSLGQGNMFTGVCLDTGGVWSRGRVPGPKVGSGGNPPPPTATAAGGTHPTGMHSCYVVKLVTVASDVLSYVFDHNLLLRN